MTFSSDERRRLRDLADRGVGDPLNLMQDEIKFEDLDSLAETVLQAMEVELSEDSVRHMVVLLTCAKIRAERGARYKDNWKNRGFKGSFMHMDSKFSRLEKMFWEETPDEKTAPTMLDDAYDLINYTTFFMQNVVAWRVWGRNGN